MLIIFGGLPGVGKTAIAVELTRNAWVSVATRAGVSAVEIEVKCSQVSEHRRRVQTRATDIHGLKLPTSEEVLRRDYQPWDREHLVIDTAGRTVQENVDAIRQVLPRR
jgi:predicted kinase